MTTVRCGPFAVAGRQLVVETDDRDVAARVTAALVDLSATAHDDDPTVFTVGRAEPYSDSHPWGVWRDGQPCETTLTDDYLLPYILWELTRLLLEVTEARLTLHAGAAALDGRAVVLVGGTGAGKSTLSAWLTHRGWGFLTDEVVILSPDGESLEPFWRPVGVRPGGPLDAVLGTTTECDRLVPASQLGRLAGPAMPCALVLPTYRPGSTGALRRLPAAEATAAVAVQAPGLTARPGQSLRAVAQLIARVPSYALEVDDLDDAELRLRQLVLPTAEVARPSVTVGRRGAIHFAVIDGEAVLYAERTTTIHQLNTSATEVWLARDGMRTAQDIANVLAVRHGRAAADIQPEVAQVLADLARLESG